MGKVRSHKLCIGQKLEPKCSSGENRVWATGVALAPALLCPTTLLPGDCTEESNQEALIAQAGEARRPLRLRVNEQYAFQKYLS